MTRSIWLNGRLVSGIGPHLQVTDRGFQLGDGVFETARVRRGVVIELDEHLRRLHESAAAILLDLPNDALVIGGIHELLEAEGLDGADDAAEPGDAAIRITVSRGPDDHRGLLPLRTQTISSTLAIQAWPYVPVASDTIASGVQAISSSIRRDPTSPLAGIKSTSRVDLVYARLEAERRGADEAIFLTLDGAASEGTTANLWILAGKRLLTPPTSAGILPGTTRTWLLANASHLGFQAVEATLTPEDVVAAEEALLTSSVAGVIPLVSLDGRPIGQGRPGPRTRDIREARERWIDDVSRAGSGMSHVGGGLR